MKSMEANAEKMEAQLKKWGATIDKLVAQAEEAGTSAKADFHKQLEKLKEKYGKAEAKLVEFKKAGIDKWDNFKADMEILWDDLAAAFKGLTH